MPAVRCFIVLCHSKIGMLEKKKCGKAQDNAAERQRDVSESPTKEELPKKGKPWVPGSRNISTKELEIIWEVVQEQVPAGSEMCKSFSVEVYSRGNGQFSVLRLRNSKIKVQQRFPEFQTQSKLTSLTHRLSSSGNSWQSREKVQCWKDRGEVCWKFYQTNLRPRAGNCWFWRENSTVGSRNPRAILFDNHVIFFDVFQG